MTFLLILKSFTKRKVVTILLLVQISLTLALLSNSVLLSKQSHDLFAQPTGLSLDTTLAITLKPTDDNLLVHPALGELIDRQIRALKEIHGVKAVTYSNQTPLMFGGMNGNVYVVGKEETTNVNSVPYNYSGHELFETLQMKLLYGRWFTEEDRETNSIVITDKLATHLFGQSDLAIGQLTSAGNVIGVVADIMYQRFASDQYFSLFLNRELRQADYGYKIILQVEDREIADIREQLSDVLRAVEPEIDIRQVVSFDELHLELFEKERGLTVLLSVLSGLMMLVAMISTYSYSLFQGIQKQNEIGIKRALGASKTMIFMDVLSESWFITVLGATLGIISSYILQTLLAKVISLPTLPLALPCIASMVLLVSVTIATWHPAALATKVSPATATKAL